MGQKSCHILEKGQKGPVFLWGYFPHERGELQLMEIQLKELLANEDYILLAYQVEDWNNDFSPWSAPMAIGNEKFQGKGPETLRWLLDTLVPWLKRKYPESDSYYLMGYSLAGLFSIWGLYETEYFDGAICCSGSFWIEGWKEYMCRHTIQAEADIYLSLGGKEEKTNNYLLSSVGDRTRELLMRLQKDPKVKRSTLEWNRGGHFGNSMKRLVKGMAWILFTKI